VIISEGIILKFGRVKRGRLKMDRLDEFRLFLAIVDTGSFAAGGRQLGRSPSSATRIIGEMEQRLGIRLLQRTTRKLSVTDGGARLAEQARRLVADFDEAINYAVGESEILHGQIRLSAPTFFGSRHIAPLVGEFLDVHSHVAMQLSLEDRLVDLIEERIDVALRIGQLENSSLVSKRVGQVRRIVVASPDYLSKHGTPRQPRDLAQHQAVCFVNHAHASAWTFRRGDQTQQRMKVSGRAEVNRADAAIVMARKGMGLVRILSYQVASELEEGSLVRVLKAYEMPPVPVQFVYPSARLLAPRVRAFLDFAAARILPLKFNRI
jgi:molybdate transport repressor ModE-like protein